MKQTLNTSRLLLFLSLSLLIFSCNRAKTPEMVTVPFTATALGEYVYAGPDTLPNPKCTGDLSAWRAIVEAKGHGDPVGDFTVHFDFCGDEESHYGNLESWLIAENGDSLFLNSSGQVLGGRLEEHPAFVTSYWKDTIRVTGGTGIYKGATGVLVGDDYNSSEDSFSHHNWSGTLTMMKQKEE